MSSINRNRIIFYQYLNGDISLEVLVDWIYTNKELEKIIPNDQYLELISYDYSHYGVDAYIKSFVKSNFDWLEYEKWRTIGLLEIIKSNEFDIFSAAHLLSQLFQEQEEEIGHPLISIELALGYESNLDDLPMEMHYKNWSPEALKSKLIIIETLRSKMIKDIDKELNRLLI